MRGMIIITVLCIMCAVIIAASLKNKYDNEYTKQYEEYCKRQRKQIIRDSIQADMKYRHDSIEYEYYKRH
jgi:transposase